jgi:hypothetical protein
MSTGRAASIPLPQAAPCAVPGHGPFLGLAHAVAASAGAAVAAALGEVALAAVACLQLCCAVRLGLAGRADWPPLTAGLRHANAQLGLIALGAVLLVSVMMSSIGGGHAAATAPRAAWIWLLIWTCLATIELRSRTGAGWQALARCGMVIAGLAATTAAPSLTQLFVVATGALLVTNGAAEIRAEIRSIR